MKTFLVDSWAMLAYLKKESPADARVVDVMEQARQGDIKLFISVINLGEVYYSIGRVRGEDFADQVLDEIRLLPVEILPADDDVVFTAARWKMKYPLSYADAFAAASTEQHEATLLTGDPELLALRDKLNIEELKRES
jgi:predicted nucleic acid-binding protein